MNNVLAGQMQQLYWKLRLKIIKNGENWYLNIHALAYDMNKLMWNTKIDLIYYDINEITFWHFILISLYVKIIFQ